MNPIPAVAGSHASRERYHSLPHFDRHLPRTLAHHPKTLADGQGIGLYPITEFLCRLGGVIPRERASKVRSDIEMGIAQTYPCMRRAVDRENASFGYKALELQ